MVKFQQHNVTLNKLKNKMFRRELCPDLLKLGSVIVIWIHIEIYAGPSICRFCCRNSVAVLHPKSIILLWKGTHPLPQRYIDAEFTENELKKAVFQQKNNKASGPDKISAEIIKVSYETISPILLKFYNKLFTNAEYPDC